MTAPWPTLERDLSFDSMGQASRWVTKAIYQAQILYSQYHFFSAKLETKDFWNIEACGKIWDKMLKNSWRRMRLAQVLCKSSLLTKSLLMFNICFPVNFKRPLCIQLLLVSYKYKACDHFVDRLTFLAVSKVMKYWKKLTTNLGQSWSIITKSMVEIGHQTLFTQSLGPFVTFLLIMDKKVTSLLISKPFPRITSNASQYWL